MCLSDCCACAIGAPERRGGIWAGNREAGLEVIRMSALFTLRELHVDAQMGWSGGWDAQTGCRAGVAQRWLKPPSRDVHPGSAFLRTFLRTPL